MDHSYFSTPSQYQFNELPLTPAQSFELPENYTAGFPADFDASLQFDHPASFLSHQSLQQPTPPTSLHRPSIAGGELANGVNGVSAHFQGAELEGTRENRSSDEERDANAAPTESRRKEQNRAAQRAFRERKERHVKDLQSKLDDMSSRSHELVTANERLQSDLGRLQIQNEILRATAQARAPSQPPQQPSPVPGPLSYSPTDFVSAVGIDPRLYPVRYDDHGGKMGERLLATGAAWDYIQAHKMYQRGQVDLAKVCERLKGAASCSGNGLVFRETDVLAAIEASVTGPVDELI